MLLEIRHGAHDGIGMAIAQPFYPGQGLHEGVPGAESPFLREGEGPDIPDLEDKSATEAPPQPESVEDGQQGKARYDDGVGRGEMRKRKPEQLHLEVEPTEDPPQRFRGRILEGAHPAERDAIEVMDQVTRLQLWGLNQRVGIGGDDRAGMPEAHEFAHEHEPPASRPSGSRGGDIF